MNKNAEERVQKLFVGMKSSLSRTDPEFVEIISNFSQDETVRASKLTQKEQMLCILSALLGCQGMGEFQNMLHAALNMGIEPVAIKEVIYQAAAYLGIGRIHDFLVTANQIMEQHGVRLPLLGQATTNEKTRFEEGLAKQIDLFGSDMAKRQEESSDLRRNINRWLADNCFGDYYTRNGLNDQEREMITFCFLLCSTTLYSFSLLFPTPKFPAVCPFSWFSQPPCARMPYIGYPRSLNALNIIDEVSERIKNQ